MSYSLEFEINDLPKMANLESGKSHWTHAMREAQKWRKLVARAVYGHAPVEPLERFSLTCVRHSSTECDYDGLVRGFKHVVDGLKYSGVILDDKLSNTGEWKCSWRLAKRKKGKIYVKVEEIKNA